MITSEDHYLIGEFHFRSPVLLYFNFETKTYHSMISQDPFLTYRPTLQKYTEHLKGDELSKQIFKILKSENAREYIRPVGYHTKKFNVTEGRRPIYQKELF